MQLRHGFIFTIQQHVTLCRLQMQLGLLLHKPPAKLILARPSTCIVQR
jgi:hypothetical protein